MRKQVIKYATDEDFKKFIKKENWKFVISLIINGFLSCVILFLIWMLCK